MFLTILLLSAVFLLTLSYLITLYNESYWRKRGIPYHRGTNVFGPFWDYAVGNRSLFLILDEVYHKYNDAPAVGTPSMFAPSLLVKDPQNIQHVFAENFKSFHHRGFDVRPDDTLSNSVIFLNGPKWKLIRQKMTPLFTISKLKNMHYIMDQSAKDFVDYLKRNDLKKDSSVYDTVQLYCCASIGAAVFGVQTGTSTFESPFLKLATSAVKPDYGINSKFATAFFAPSFFKLTGLKLFTKHEKSFISAIKQILRERENSGLKGHDFADLAISIQKNGKIKDDATDLEMDPTDELMAAQGFFFLIAGVDPSATGICGTLFELSRNPDILKKVHEEIDKVFEEQNGNITYDVISKFTYLEKVIEESLRMHPPIGTIGRKCTEEAVLPVGQVKVAKGTHVTVPVYSVHYDPMNYPNPRVFDPERFSPEAVKQRMNMTFIPFGEGNRLCIGFRFAYLQMKTGLVHLLRNFSVTSTDPTAPVVYEKSPFALRIMNKDLKFIVREKCR